VKNNIKACRPGKGAGIYLLAMLLTVRFVYPQPSSKRLDPATLAAGHSGAVSSMAFDSVRNCVLTAGMDGFLGIWDMRTLSATDRFQASPYPIRSMILRPGKSQVALVESDGVGTYRISAWDYALKRNLFTLRFRDPITFINYSGAGSFLIVGRSARTGVVFIHPETGVALDSPRNQTGNIIFAATGKSERTMMTYATAGRLAYGELNTGKVIQDSVAPPNMGNPILFGNNRYLSGIDANGLVVLDAVTGKELARDRNVERGRLFPVASSDLLEFLYLGTMNNSASRGNIILTHYTITTRGTLEGSNQTAFSAMPLISDGVGAGGGAIALGTVDGGVWIFGPTQSTPQAMNKAMLTRINSAAVSGDNLAFLTEDQRISILPLDYYLLRERSTMFLESARGNSHISGDPSTKGRFLLWQSNDIRSYPILINGAGTPERTDVVLSRLALRHPLRYASLLDNQILLLDSVGNINLASVGTGESKFTYTATDPLDISFMDRENIIIGQADLNQNSPFLLVNTVTEETVPFNYPATVGAKLYRSSDGSVYGGVVEGSSDSAITTLLLLDVDNPDASRRLVEYQGEDTTFIIAQSGGSVASTLGGNGPTLHSNQGFVAFERTPSLPVNLLGSEKYFIVLGQDGSISWHNNATGSLLARLRLLETEWILDTPDRGRVRGPFKNN
jgi:hypothetical protein